MWGTTIQVGYMPEFTFELKQFIRENVTPSLVSNNEEDGTNQYFIDTILVALEDTEVANENDIAIFQAMENEGITYCEF